MRTDNAADNLTGYTLPGNWRVRDKVPRRPDDTGGRFSVSYIVERDGQEAFCKVLNFGWILDAQGEGDPARRMQQATEYYNFERDIAKECVGLSKVVTAIADGQTFFEDFRVGTISYIIFEMAESDVRRMLNATAFVDFAVKFRLLRDLATGVRQLHSHRIAHQDIKPSNLLIFQEDGLHSGKIGDLGRVVLADRPGPFNDLVFAGDQAYAPPEALYHASIDGFGPRRLAADLYQLGGMLAFCLTGFSINMYLRSELLPEMCWDNWAGTFDEALPYLTDAMGRVIPEVVGRLPESMKEPGARILRQLCEVDPRKRGDTRRVGRPNQYSLERFVSALDLLAAQARHPNAR